MSQEAGAFLELACCAMNNRAVPAMLDAELLVVRILARRVGGRRLAMAAHLMRERIFALKRDSRYCT